MAGAFLDPEVAELPGVALDPDVAEGVEAVKSGAGSTSASCASSVWWVSTDCCDASATFSSIACSVRASYSANASSSAFASPMTSPCSAFNAISSRLRLKSVSWLPISMCRRFRVASPWSMSIKYGSNAARFLRAFVITVCPLASFWRWCMLLHFVHIHCKQDSQNNPASCSVHHSHI